MITIIHGNNEDVCAFTIESLFCMDIEARVPKGKNVTYYELGLCLSPGVSHEITFINHSAALDLFHALCRLQESDAETGDYDVVEHTV